jgi:hypothetical protein
MATATNTPVLCVSQSVFFCKHIGLYYLTKRIVWAGIIGNDSPKLSYDTVILKDREKNLKLVFPAITFNFAKSKESLCPLQEMVGVVRANSQEKVSI